MAKRFHWTVLGETNASLLKIKNRIEKTLPKGVKMSQDSVIVYLLIQSKEDVNVENNPPEV